MGVAVCAAPAQAMFLTRCLAPSYQTCSSTTVNHCTADAPPNPCQNMHDQHRSAGAHSQAACRHAHAHFESHLHPASAGRREMVCIAILHAAVGSNRPMVTHFVQWRAKDSSRSACVQKPDESHKNRGSLCTCQHISSGGKGNVGRGYGPQSIPQTHIYR